MKLALTLHPRTTVVKASHEYRLFGLNYLDIHRYTPYRQLGFVIVLENDKNIIGGHKLIPIHFEVIKKVILMLSFDSHNS